MSARLLGLAFDAEAPSASAKLVLIKLVDCCDDEGRKIFPSIATLARAAQCDARTVQRHIAMFCTVGLLRMIRAGGQGRGSTSHYEMNLDVLRLIVAKGWAAVAALAGSRGDDTPDDDAGHAESAYQGEDTGESDAPAKGDTTPPLTANRMTNGDVKGDTRVTQPLNINPQEFERERGRAGAGLGAQPGAASHAQNAAPDLDHLPGLPEFVKRWPTSAADDQARVSAEWGQLTMAERRAALDSIEPFLDYLKREKRSHRPAGWKYLGEKRWSLLPEMRRAASQGEVAAVPAFSKGWWALFHRARAEGKNPKFMLQAAGSGKPWAAKQGDLVAAQPETLKGFPVDGETAARFLAEAGRAGFHFPAFRAGTWIFLPDRMAEAGAVGEAGFS